MTLKSVFFDNMRTIQAGTTEGVDPKVAQDIGYLTEADEAAVKAETERFKRSAERDLGRTMLEGAEGAGPRAPRVPTRSPLPVNESVRRARQSVRNFHDSASVDRPEQRVQPYQPLSTEQREISRTGAAEARAMLDASVAHAAQNTAPFSPLPPEQIETNRAGMAEAHATQAVTRDRLQ